MGMSMAGFDPMALINSYIAVVTRPGSTKPFDEAKGKANWVSTVVGVVVLGLVQAIFSLIFVTALGAAFGVAGVAFGASVTSLITTPIFTLISFFIFAFVLQYVAQWQGGKGDLLTTAYALSLVYVPVGIVAAVLLVVPFLGGFAALLGLIYELVLMYFGVQSVHGLDSNKAIIVLAVTAVVVIVASVVIGALAAGFGFYGRLF